MWLGDFYNSKASHRRWSVAFRSRKGVALLRCWLYLTDETGLILRHDFQRVFIGITGMLQIAQHWIGATTPCTCEVQSVCDSELTGHRAIDLGLIDRCGEYNSSAEIRAGIKRDTAKSIEHDVMFL